MSWPPFRMFMAMLPPMIPKPTNPMFIAGLPVLPARRYVRTDLLIA